MISAGGCKCNSLGGCGKQADQNLLPRKGELLRAPGVDSHPFCTKHRFQFL